MQSFVFLLSLACVQARLYVYRNARLPLQNRVGMYMGKTNDLNACFNYCRSRHFNINGAEVMYLYVSLLLVHLLT